MKEKHSIIIGLNHVGNKLVVELFGALTIETAGEFTAAVEGELDEVMELVLDMKKISYITSAGIRGVLRVIKKLFVHNGKVICTNVNDEVLHVFKITDVISLVEIKG